MREQKQVVWLMFIGLAVIITGCNRGPVSKSTGVNKPGAGWSEAQYEEYANKLASKGLKRLL